MWPRLILLKVVAVQSLVWTITFYSCFAPASLAVISFHQTAGRSCSFTPTRKHHAIHIPHSTNDCGAHGFRRRSSQNPPPTHLLSSSYYYSSFSSSMRTNSNMQRLDLTMTASSFLTKNNNNLNSNNESIPSALYATSSNKNKNKNGHADKDEDKINAVDSDTDNNNGGGVPTHGFVQKVVKARDRRWQLLVQNIKKRIQRGRTFLGRYNRTSSTKTQRILTKLRHRVILLLGIVGFFTYYHPKFLAPYILQLQSVPSHLDPAAAVRTAIHNDTLQYSAAIVHALAYLKSIKNDILYGDDLWP